MNLAKKLISIVLFATICLTACVGFAKSEITNYEIIIPPQFDEVRDFSEGYAAVKTNGKWGYVNEKGEFVVQPKYDYAASFAEGKALCGYLLSDICSQTSVWDLKIIDTVGNEIDLKPGPYYTGEVKDDFGNFVVNKIGADTNWEYSLYDTYDYHFNNGHLAFSAAAAYGGVSGRFVYNSYGELVFVFSTNNSGQTFNDGLISGDYEHFNKVYVMDKNKNEVFSYNRDEAIYYNNVAYYMTQIYMYSADHATALLKTVNGGTYHLAIIDKKGNIKYVSESDYMAYSTLDSTNSSKTGTLNGMMCTANAQKLYGVVDTNGNVRVPFIYDNILPCREGLIAVKKSNKWGYVDTNGNIAVPIQYDKVTGFYEGMALVVKDGVPYIIDRYNNVYTNYENIDLSYYFTNNGLTRTLSGNIVVISANGKNGFAKIDYNVELPKKEEMSEWAHSEVVKSIENRLIPINMRNKYSENINRADFATLVVNLLKEMTGKTADEIKTELLNINPSEFYNSNPFADIAGEDIIIANKLGIINGISADTFNHASNITRQDAAVMIMRLAKYLKPETNASAVVFADDKNISEYAKEAVSFVTSNNIMKGTGNNEFSPLSNITREQAYITVMRVMENLK